MALPKLYVEIEADTDGAEAGLDRVERGLRDVDRQAHVSNRGMRQLGAGMGRAARSSGAMKAAIQNASFQLGDFAVMVGGGVDASRALATQLPQLLGPFGALGAIMSAVVAIGIPLAAVFADNAEASGALRDALGTVYPMVEVLSDVMRQAGAIAVQFGELVINNLDRIIITAGVAASFFAGKFVAAFIAARVAAMSFAGALAFVRGALIRTGIGAIIVTIGEAVYQFTRLAKAAGGFGEAIAALKDVFIEAFERMQHAGWALELAVVAVAAGVEGAWLRSIATMQGAWAKFVGSVAGVALKIPGMEGIGSDLAFRAGMLGQGVSELQSEADMADLRSEARGSQARQGLLNATKPLESVQKIRDLLQSIKDDKITLPDLLGAGVDDGGGGEKKDPLKEKLEGDEKRIKEHFDRIKALTEGSMSDRLGAWGNYFGALATLTGTNNKKLLAIQKSFAAAQALIDAWSAYNQVLADPSLPWFAKFAAAGQVLAAGIGAVSAIKSVSASATTAATVGGGGGGGGTSTVGAASSAPAQSVLDVRVTGVGPRDIFTGSQVSDLFEMLQKEAGDRGLGRVTFA